MPAALLLHAFPVNHEMWKPQLAAVPSGWTVLAPDFRGFGDAPPDADGRRRRAVASMDEYADDAARALDEQHIDRAVVCGCSMGGYAALAMLRRHAHRVAGLVLADTRATADTEQGRAGRRTMLDLLDRAGAPAALSQLLPKLVGATTRATRPDVVAAVGAMAARASADGIGHAIVRMMNRPDSAAMLAAFPGPVLVVVGAEDELTPVAESEVMVSLRPGSRLVVVPGAGHLSNLEVPDVFNAALAAFLESHDVAAVTS